ncbi:aspartyl/asparaginyl beta-hydroxylase domain-containing protein [Sphingomonas sp.]|uniref:aspartyl/asparaginyl beta-hydroxylase domain-containing protein n=1 Tax=Sphingomonas sp. TaxID=28214 RepID=UPI002BB99D87|nr:aspartyl/asparaginyl beta-hydroxylase domain-containing protein [Sphingomonas sp.]HTG38882.1 aspartyl/asparaginyl beta-hydroxylase domain-containing protein [Sphingomonas sp.]
MLNLPRSTPPASDRTAPVPPSPRRGAATRVARRLCPLSDRLIGGSSLVPNQPLLDMRGFPWTGALRHEWTAIRDEARAVVRDGSGAEAFCLHGCGYPVVDNLARCPRTAAALAGVPGLKTAFFATLAPGAHVPPHRGVTKGLITCHLALVVPRDGDARMRVGDRIVRWAEGETLVFDDTYDHEAWNDAADPGIILSIQFERPLAQPGKWLADLLMGLVRRSPRVRHARAEPRRWAAAIGRMHI